MFRFVFLLVICSCCCFQVKAFQWPTLPSFTEAQQSSSSSIRSVGERNGLDEEYPWRFEGRFVFRPSLVRITPSSSTPPSANLLSLFGYSLGGSVILEYDISPVGPYREYVTMGGVVGAGEVSVGESNKKLLTIGQWGTDLYVSTQVAEDVCKQVWGGEWFKEPDCFHLITSKNADIILSSCISTCPSC
jgi:hypothetical protein